MVSTAQGQKQAVGVGGAYQQERPLLSEVQFSVSSVK